MFLLYAFIVWVSNLLPAKILTRGWQYFYINNNKINKYIFGACCYSLSWRKRLRDASYSAMTSLSTFQFSSFDYTWYQIARLKLFPLANLKIVPCYLLYKTATCVRVFIYLVIYLFLYLFEKTSGPKDITAGIGCKNETDVLQNSSVSSTSSRSS